ncbi:putative ribonuclease H-like domain-containing protein [Tanacetum coccineum]
MYINTSTFFIFPRDMSFNLGRSGLMVLKSNLLRIALETANDEEVARKVQEEWDAEERKKKVEGLKKAKTKTILKKPTSLAQERNRMMNFLKGQGYKNLQKLRYPQMKELYDKVQDPSMTPSKFYTKWPRKKALVQSPLTHPIESNLIIFRANNQFRAFNTLWEIQHIMDRQDLYHLKSGHVKAIMSHPSKLVRLEDGTMIHMLAERRYPLSRVDDESEDAGINGMEVEDEEVKISITLITLFHFYCWYKSLCCWITTARRITTVRRIKTSKEIRIVWRTRILTKIRIDQGLGSTSGIRAFALRNFDLEVMEFESAHSNTTAKLPILKLGEYEMWVIRIKQYFQVQDYALWEVIENGNSWVSVPQTAQENGTSVTKMSVPVTAEEKTNKKNDVKARSLLLMALPNEHQLTFSQYNDAKTMFAAIETRFGGNEATKKTQKTLLKQQYENFSASSTESLDSIFNRLQKIVSRLAILGVVITQEDLNSNFLTSLPPEWNTHVVVWMNKAEIETMSIDDLYNNFKIVEQSVKKSVSASSGAQNLAFMTAPSTSSTNDDNTAKPTYEVSNVSPNVNTASPQVSTASFSDNVVYAFMVENPNGSNLLQQDLEKIHEDDLEAIDLKWQLSLLSMRAKRYFQRTGKKIFINANDIAGYDKSKVECFNYHKMGYFARECRAPRNKEGQFKYQDNTRKQGNNEDASSKAMLAIDGVGFDWSDMAEEQVQTNIALMTFSDSKDSKLESNIVCDTKSDDSKENSDDNFEFVKPKNHEKPVKKSVRYAEMYRSQSPRGNQRNWNGQKSNQLGSDFVMYNKACFICGSFDHVQAHYNYIIRERMVYGNNYNRVNYNYTTNMTHPNPQRNMVPRAVLMKTGLKPFNTGRTVNTAHPQSIVFNAKPMSCFSKSAQSTVKRPYQSKTVLTNKKFTQKNNTAKAKAVNTTRPKAVNTAMPHLAVVNVVRANQVNVVKVSAWQEFDGGYVTFGGGAHGGRISGKGTLKTDSLDFEVLKYNPNESAGTQGELNAGNKARLVAQGHRQEEGIDYEEVFAPVARIKAIRLFLAYASFMGFLVYQMDVKSAFLYETIEEDVYVLKQQVLKILTIRQSYKVVKEFMGLHQAQVLVYVDDIIFGFTNKEQCNAFEKLMKDKFQMSSIGELTFFLGLQVTQKEDGIFISQDKYVAEILKKFNYTDVKSASTPVDLEKPLVKDGDANDVDVHLYRSMIGYLMYLIASRPNIMFAAKHIEYLMLKTSPLKYCLMGGYLCQAWMEGHQSRDVVTSIGPNPWQHLMSHVLRELVQVVVPDVKNIGVGKDSMITYGIDGTLYKTNELFWGTTTARTTNDGEVEIIASIDGQVKTITEVSLRRHLKLEDSDDFPLFPTMITTPKSSPSRITSSPSLSPKTYQSPLRDITRQDAEIPQSQFPTKTQVADEAVFTSVDVDAGGAATIEIGLEAECRKEKDKGKAFMKEDEDVQKKTKNDPVVLRYHALQNRSFSIAKVRKNMCMYLKNQGGYKQSHFKGMSYEDIRPIFKRVWDQNNAFVPKDSEIEKEVIKRHGFDFQQRYDYKQVKSGYDFTRLLGEYLKILFELMKKKNMEESMELQLDMLEIFDSCGILYRC